MGLAALFIFAGFQANAARNDLKNLSQEDFKHLRADSWRVVGNNVILNGNVYMPVGNTEIFADKVIINLHSRDFEAAGSVRVHRWQDISGATSLKRVAELEQSPNTLVKSQNEQDQ